MSKDYRRKNKIEGAFAPRRIEMLESPAYQVLTLSARRVLDRLEIELAHHAGFDNGKLAVTFEHFMEFGIHDHAIAPALRELEALGFIEITEHGRSGNGEYRRANKFRLTYRHVDRANPTEEWTRIKSVEEATMRASKARLTPARNISQWRKTRNINGGNHHRKPKSPMVETTSTVPMVETTSTSISRVPSPELGGRASAPIGSAVASEPAGSSEKNSRVYTLSSNPRAHDQYGTIEYHGRPFIIASDGQLSGKPPTHAIQRRAG
jgi:hypothetical protein